MQFPTRLIYSEVLSQLGAVAAVGLAVLLVYAAIRAFNWLRSGL